MTIDIDDSFEIPRTISGVKTGSYLHVALQFPDDLLPFSTDVALRLSEQANKGLSDSSAKHTFYILADTTYGSCCVDEVAAQHVNADLIVHYGRSCSSRTSRFPVLYVFGNPVVDVHHCISSLSAALLEASTSPPANIPILLMYDAVYCHSVPAISTAMANAGFRDLVVSTIDTDVGVVQQDNASSSSYGRKYVIPQGRLLEEFIIVYIGGESLTLTNILITHSANRGFSYDPVAKVSREESSAVNKLLRRRYVMVQKAKDADVIGIVVGTLGVVSYLPLIEHLKRLITASGKKPYLIAVGKPSPAKLGNFLEIQVFVLVACPENTLVDSKEFMQPIVTPYELEIALARGKEWIGNEYETDLGKLALRVGKEAELVEEAGRNGQDADDEPHFSLMTGGYKQRKQYLSQENAAEDDLNNQEGAVQLRKPAGAVSKFIINSAAAEFLNINRTFKGLEVKMGETEIVGVGEGRAGVASGYTEEGERK